ncbi:MAG: AsmA family protein, partial [bacterium]|nr:AsmA family protein [bacterium]
MRRKILIGIAIVAAIPLLAAAIALLYLNFADLGGWRSTVEELVTDALGRELRIAGEFKPDIGFTTRLVASEVTLANPDGWPEPHMVSVDRLEAELDLLSVLFGPLTIHEVLMDGATVLLAKDGNGRATWQFETGAADARETNEGSEPFELVFDHVSITGLDLVFSDYSLPQSISFVDAALDLRSDDAGIIDLNLTGELNDAKLDLKGRLGTLRNVLAAGPLEHDLRGQLGDVEIGLKGRIGDLASLEGIDIVAEVAGSDLATVGSRFGVSGLPVGPFRLDVAASPSPAGSSVVVACNLGEITARFDGKVDSLPAFKDLELDIEASGPSVAEVGAMSGLDGLPNSPFKVAGHVHWQGFPVAFDSFQATVGDNRLALEGVLGAPPDMLDTDFAIKASGPNIGALAALAGLQLPEKAFQVNGRLVRTDAGINVENVAARIGATTFNADGVVGVPPEFTGTTLTLSAKGPDMSAYADLLGIDLPAESFAVAGRLIPEGDYIALEGVKARLGRNKGTIAGKIKAAAGFVGSDIRLTAEGPGLVWLEPITGLSDLPAQPYRVDGRLRVRSAGLQLDDVKVGFGDLSLKVGGFVASSPGFEGTKVS